MLVPGFNTRAILAQNREQLEAEGIQKVIAPDAFIEEPEDEVQVIFAVPVARKSVLELLMHNHTQAVSFAL